MTRTLKYNAKLEIFRFLVYTFTAIMVMLVISELVLLMYWRFNPSFKSQTINSQAPFKYQTTAPVTAAEYERNVQTVVDEWRLGAPRDLANYQNFNEQLLSLKVPPARQEFHLQLVLLVEKSINSLQEQDKKNTREDKVQFDLDKNQLNNFMNNTDWLVDRSGGLLFD